jgi:hypothetical protein
MDRENKYKKEITGFYFNVPEVVKFETRTYESNFSLTILLIT